jgi:hypothetical protein
VREERKERQRGEGPDPVVGKDGGLSGGRPDGHLGLRVRALTAPDESEGRDRLSLHFEMLEQLWCELHTIVGLSRL